MAERAPQAGLANATVGRCKFGYIFLFLAFSEHYISEDFQHLILASGQSSTEVDELTYLGGRSRRRAVADAVGDNLKWMAKSALYSGPSVSQSVSSSIGDE